MIPDTNQTTNVKGNKKLENFNVNISNFIL